MGAGSTAAGDLVARNGWQNGGWGEWQEGRPGPFCTHLLLFLLTKHPAPALAAAVAAITAPLPSSPLRCWQRLHALPLQPRHR
jgi:hypothetical protein